MSSCISSLQQASSSYLQKADAWLAATLPSRLMLIGCGLGTSILVSKKLPVGELLTRAIDSLEHIRPDLPKKISWIVPVGAIALSTAITSAIFRATSSPILRCTALAVHCGISDQFIIRDSELEVVSLETLFQSWSGASRKVKDVSPKLNMLAKTTSFVFASTLSILCYKLGRLSVLTTTLIATTIPAVYMLTLKIAQSWNARSSI